ncbi:MAG TPA: hypothetical protein VG247_05320 [Pseudonocardiaceae bacterium]|nr:hypothetical protein [Pseudonocardiaceae bacterium]
MNSVVVPPEYVAARAVLLDALDALEAHLDSIILVGAQAVYLHTGDTDLSVAPTTTDADVALAPDRVADAPLLGAVLASAGFVLSSNPGSWIGRGDVAIDIMVPDALCPAGGTRGARLPVHGNKVARRTLGLEPAIVDNEPREIVAFAPSDGRRRMLRVAGPAALIVAKAIKIGERRDCPRRLKPKDGLDVLRLLQFVDMKVISDRLCALLTDPMAGDVTGKALAVLREDGCEPDGLIARLAATALPTENWDTTTQSVASLIAELVDACASSSLAD